MMDFEAFRQAVMKEVLPGLKGSIQEGSEEAFANDVTAWFKEHKRLIKKKELHTLLAPYLRK